MSLLFETILIEEGKAPLLPWHQARFDRSRQMLFGSNRHIDLGAFIHSSLPEGKGQFRCRIDYGEEIMNIAFLPYRPSGIASVSLIEANEIEYPYKFADRQDLEALKTTAATDEIIILKNGLVTDASIANLVFWKEGKAYTPDTPLLAGTRRQMLIEHKRIQACRIRGEDIRQFEGLSLINALRPLDPAAIITMNNVLNI
jgi:4-amino-4-deoxychorismate lyase